MPNPRLPGAFFHMDVLEVCPALIGQILCRQHADGSVIRRAIFEVEAYKGTEDLACHASKGRTARTEIMFAPGGHLYVYLIYGMYWMLNVVTGAVDSPQAALIRGVEGCSGPGRLGRLYGIDATFYGENLSTSSRIWIEPGNLPMKYTQSGRVGVEYAGPNWVKMPWRYTACR